MTPFEQLQTIAAQHAAAGYLSAYATDLTRHDRAILDTAPAGARFLWILRSHGTELFRIGVGRDPVWATYWLDEQCAHAPPIPYLIDIDANRVRLVGHGRARQLALQPAPLARRIA